MAPDPDDLGPTDFALGVCSSSEPAGNMSVASSGTYSTPAVCGQNGQVEITVFGKVHWLSCDDFLKQAGHFANMLYAQQTLLVQELEALLDVWNDVHARWWLFGSKVARALAATDIDALHATALAIPDARTNVDENRLHDIGLKLERARISLADLKARASEHREAAIESAATEEEALRLVADTAFGALTVIIKVMTPGNPVAELGYRLAALIVEGAAYSAGAGIAYGAGGPVLQQAAMVLKNRGPSILVDFLMGALGKQMGGNPKYRKIAEYVARQVLEFNVDLMMLLIDKGVNVSKDDVMLLAERRLYAAMSALIGLFLGFDGETVRGKELAKMAVQAVVDTVAGELAGLRKTAEDNKTTLGETVLTRMPFLIAKVLTNLLNALLGKHAEGKKNEDAAKAAAKPSTPVEKPDAAPDAERAADPPPRVSVPFEALRAPSEELTKRLLARIEADAITTNAFHPQAERRGKGMKPLTQDELRATKVWMESDPMAPKPKGATGDDDSTKGIYTRVEIEALRGIAHKFNVILLLRATNPLSRRYVGNPAYWTKTTTIHTVKTAKEGAHAGLLALDETLEARKAFVERAKPEDRAEIEHERADMKAAGYFIREDGLIFHPKMLEQSAKARGAEDPQALVAILKRASDKGFLDLGEPDAAGFVQTQIDALRPDLRAGAAAAWKHANEPGAPFGIRGDHDFFEVVDASTGYRVSLGSTAKNRVTKANRDRLNALIGITLGRSVPVNHGGVVEDRKPDGTLTFDKYAIDAVVGFFPGGGVRFVDGTRSVTSSSGVQQKKSNTEVREAVEVSLRDELGPLYKSDTDRHAHAQQPTPGFQTEQPRPDVKAIPGAFAKGEEAKAPTGKLVAKVVSQLPRVGTRGALTIALPIARVSALELQASQATRGLVVLHPANALMLKSLDADTLRTLWAAQRTHEVSAALDPAGKNLVLSTHAHDSVTNAVRRLVDFRGVAGFPNGPTPWWEIVAPVTFTSFGGVGGILPGGVGAPAAHGPLDVVSVAASRQQQQLIAFRAMVAQESFRVGGNVTASRLDAFYRSTGDKGSIEAVKIDGRTIALFREPLVRFASEPARSSVALCDATQMKLDLDAREELALALVHLGWLGRTDAADQAHVDDAVRAFQANNGLDATGTLDGKTKSAVEAALKVAPSPIVLLHAP